jgi:uncharacterized protein (DUF362 family)
MDISVYHTSPESLVDDIRKTLGASDFSRWDFNAPTYIKMNGNYDRHYPGSNTSPWFMNALLAALRDKGFKNLIVIEGDLPYFTADQMIHRTGMINILKQYNVPFINYQNLPRDENHIPKMLLGSQVINVPVPHGHGFAVISCAVKNLFGLLPNPRRRFHKNLSDIILMLANKIKPYTIVDATVGLIGPSTRRGKPVRMDLIIAGWDAIGVDVVLTKMTGYEITSIPCLKLANQRKLIPDITLKGDYDWNSLPVFDWTLNVDASRKIANWLESTWIEDVRLFQIIENRLERIYHHLTFMKKHKMLFSGPWMEYEKSLRK